MKRPSMKNDLRVSERYAESVDQVYSTLGQLRLLEVRNPIR